MSNASLSENSTGWKNQTSASPIDSTYRNRIKVILTADAIFLVFGTFLNIWFLLAILRSRDLRASMRNKIVCHLLVVNLTETVVQCPLGIWLMVASLLEMEYITYCYQQTVFSIIYHVLDFVANWLLVTLISVFLAQVTNFDLKLKRLWIILFNVVLFATPWIVALLMVPTVMSTFYYRYDTHSCFHATIESVKVSKSLDTIVPLTVSIVVLLVAVIWRPTRSPSRHYSGNIRAQLLESGPSLDPVKAYVTLVVIAVLCDTPLSILFTFFEEIYLREGIWTVLILEAVFVVIAASRVIWSTLTFLLFPDIRARIRTWRPWSRCSTQTDLVISYKKDSV